MKALIWDGAYFLPRLSTQASPLSPVMILYGTRSMSFLTIGSIKRRPIRRLIAKNVFSGLVTAWRLAAWPTRRSPDSVKATIEGVVRMPSLFSITLAFLPSITATQEFVVPRSIPMTLLMDTSFQKQDRTARGSTVPIPREVIVQSSPDCGRVIYVSRRAATTGRGERVFAMVIPRCRWTRQTSPAPAFPWRRRPLRAAAGGRAAHSPAATPRRSYRRVCLAVRLRRPPDGGCGRSARRPDQSAGSHFAQRPREARARSPRHRREGRACARPWPRIRAGCRALGADCPPRRAAPSRSLQSHISTLPRARAGRGGGHFQSRRERAKGDPSARRAPSRAPRRGLLPGASQPPPRWRPRHCC